MLFAVNEKLVPRGFEVDRSSIVTGFRPQAYQSPPVSVRDTVLKGGMVARFLTLNFACSLQI
jgi:hypothetical protein